MHGFAWAKGVFWLLIGLAVTAVMNILTLLNVESVLVGLGFLILGLFAILLVRAMFRPWERGRKDRDQGNRDYDRTPGSYWTPPDGGSH